MASKWINLPLQVIRETLTKIDCYHLLSYMKPSTSFKADTKDLKYRRKSVTAKAIW